MQCNRVQASLGPFMKRSDTNARFHVCVALVEDSGQADFSEDPVVVIGHLVLWRSFSPLVSFPVGRLVQFQRADTNHALSLFRMHVH